MFSKIKFSFILIILYFNCCLSLLKSNQIIESNNELALNLLQILSTDSENTFFSPLSLSKVLFQLLNGAKGQTFQELKDLLHIQNNSI
jgi:serine protease inhibitor